MKLLTAVFSILFFCFTTVLSAQNAPVVTLGTVSTSASSVVVSVTANNFTNISSCDLKIHYNPAVVSAKSVTKGINLGGSASFNLTVPGEIIIGWYTSPFTSMPNGSAIFNITFNTLSNGNSPLTFDIVNVFDCHFYNASNQELIDIPTDKFYIPGSLTFNNESPVTTAPTLTAAVNDKIDIPVIVGGFNKIGAVSLTLNYDPAVLGFNSGSNTGNYPGLVFGNPVPGTIVIGGFTSDANGYTLANGSVFFTLNFTYKGGSSELSWNDNGESCEYTGPLSEVVLSDTPQSTYYINGSVSSNHSTPAIVMGTVTNPVTCGGNGIIPITFTNVPDGAYTIFYNSGSFSNIAVSASAATIGAPAGTYNNLQITVNGVTSAEGVNAVLIDPEKPVVPTITVGGPTTFCQGGSVVLTSDEASAYLWSTGETTQNITVSASGNYSVNVTNGAGCSASSEVTVVTVNAKPEKPAMINCWDDFQFNETLCSWGNKGTEPVQPEKVNCWDEFVFNTNSCEWENSGVKPEKPAIANCWDEFVFNTNNCEWENRGVKSETPVIENCWDEFVFNTNNCEWENNGVKPEKPAMVNCWDEFVFSTTSCAWEKNGVKPEKPAMVNCWDVFVFSTTSCAWENSGVKPEKPAMVNCWDEFIFNATSCEWENNGVKPEKPAVINCWDDYRFNETLCTWENHGVKPVEPAPLKSWDEFIFNPVSCKWENIGVATGVEIHGHAAEITLTSYPNPFSEKAIIKYLLPQDGRVNMEVTGILGNRIILLSNQFQTVGEYLLDLEGEKLASGIYQITLRLKGDNGGAWTKTIRMIKQ